MTANKNYNEGKQLAADSETINSSQTNQLDVSDRLEIDDYSKDFVERILSQKESDFVEVDCDALIAMLDRMIDEAERMEALDRKEQGE
ncbi:hypothetical protein HMPREF1487_09589 [Pseudomonas sp. HPB0071]|uniref:hypothetical protein n=1 Tax=unclassified Pseudomonas TaxID=196821 RepID=UPI0002C9186E|nr:MULTISPECIES: hypothetical protein [unclassified Pseudomonas]ENA26548.1 hypothetical protein HMPREF1487_09589 [Pseudomonas sp. HPB0071]